MLFYSRKSHPYHKVGSGLRVLVIMHLTVYFYNAYALRHNTIYETSAVPSELLYVTQSYSQLFFPAVLQCQGRRRLNQCIIMCGLLSLFISWEQMRRGKFSFI
jgi:hypothetical protein